MISQPNKERLSRLAVKGVFGIGDDILFCPSCDWQATAVQAMRNQCPDCGKHGLHISKVDQELLDLTPISVNANDL